MKFIFYLLFLFFFIIVSSQEKKGETKKLIFRSDSGSYQEYRGKYYFTGKGNSYLELDDNKIYCDSVEIQYVKKNNEEQIEKAVFEKNVRIFNDKEEIQIGGEKAEYIKAEKKFVIRENCYYIDAKNEVAVFGDTIYNYEDEEVTIIQGNTRIYQKEIFAKGAFVKYTKKDKQMSVSGFPVVKNQGSEYSARKIIVDVDKNTFILQGDLQAEIINSN